MAEGGGVDGSDLGALDRARLALSSVEAAALAGLAAAILMVSSVYLIGRQPGVYTASRDLSWYGDPGNRFTVELGLTLGAIAMVAFLWFMAVIRRRLANREDQFHATIFLGSGIAFVILATTAAVCAAAPTLVVHFGGEESLSDSTFALAHGLWFGLWGIAASRFVGVFMSATSTLGLRSEHFRPGSPVPDSRLVRCSPSLARLPVRSAFSFQPGSHWQASRCSSAAGADPPARTAERTHNCRSVATKRGPRCRGEQEDNRRSGCFGIGSSACPETLRGTCRSRITILIRA